MDLHGGDSKHMEMDMSGKKMEKFIRARITEMFQ